MRTRGRVTIPAKVRRKLGLEDGTTLVLEVKGDEIVLRPRRRRPTLLDYAPRRRIRRLVGSA